MNKKTVSSVIAQMLKRMGIDVLFRYIPARIRNISLAGWRFH